MKKISDSANKLSGQPMFQILAKANKLEKEGRRILHFELGDSSFDTPSNILDSAKDSLDRGETHYVNSKGILEFRETISNYIKETREFKPTLNQVLICPGANAGIFYILGCVMNPGDEVIIPEPYFPTYLSAIDFFNGKAVKVGLKEENEFRLNPEDVEKMITDKTKLIIMNSPQNPTGAVMTKEEINKIYEIAKKNDIYLITDEIYSEMIYPEAGSDFYSPSVYDKCRDNVIIIGGFSKSHAMSGWRLGFVVGPEELIHKMSLLIETSVSCVSPFIQRAGIEAIEGDQTDIKNMINKYKERRDILVDGLNSIPKISCLKPNGAFYVFCNISETGFSDKEFCDYLLENAGVACAPGTIFGENCKNYVRFCYSSSKEDILEAIEKIRDVLK
jgi:aspartate/methionine/tyrosine aminotransferase